MKKLIDKINIEKIAYGFYLIDKGISLILNIVTVSYTHLTLPTNSLV